MIAFNSEKIKNMLEKKIHHPYLEQYVNQPMIDLDKIALLLMIYEDVAITKEHREKQIISTMLVQMALDTHDLVTNESESISSEIERQLSVLAGDYYSGLYYKTLAEIEENSLIRALAHAIKVINEQKMLLYNYELNNWDLLIDTLQVIESVLLTNVGELYELSTVDLQYIKDYVIVNRLKKEKEAIKSQSFSYIEAYTERNLITVNESSVIYQIDKTIEKYQDQLESLRHDSRFTFEKLHTMLYDKKILSAVEEG